MPVPTAWEKVGEKSMEIPQGEKCLGKEIPAGGETLEQLRREREIYRELLQRCRSGKGNCHLLSSLYFYGEKIRGLNERIERLEGIQEQKTPKSQKSM